MTHIPPLGIPGSGMTGVHPSLWGPMTIGPGLMPTPALDLRAAPPKKGLTVALDMDEVLCEMVRALLDGYRVQTGHHVAFEEMVNYEVKTHLTQMDNPWDALPPEKYAQVDLVPGAAAGVGLLRERGFDVIVVTASWLKSPWPQIKAEWLLRHGFADFHKGEVHCTPVKTRVQWDVLVDDKVENIYAALEAGRAGILFDRPWNRDPFARMQMRVLAERHQAPFMVADHWSVIPGIIESWQAVWTR